MSKSIGIDRDLLLSNSNIMSALAVVAVIGLMILPVSPIALDLLLTFNIAFAVIILLVALYLKEPLQFSSFPSLLLMVTLFRLSLNVASTRLILGHGKAGNVIESFGDFVVGGNYVIGVIVFAILVLVQFVVITKGSGRIAEVAARFTLDAMPGKQMAIDADLNAGIISESDARKRREEVTSEAEFFGAMDGASKFVRGDAIAGIIITLINIVGGFVIGMIQMKLSAGDAIRQFTLLTVGDGLVSQIPALLVSTAAGMVVTRQSSTLNLGQTLTLQIFRQPKAIYLASAALAVFGLIPGLPTMPFLSLAAIFAVAAKVVGSKVEKSVEYDEEQNSELDSEIDNDQETRDISNSDLYILDNLELELGYGLLPLVDEKRGGDLLHRVTNIRKQISAELGIVVHPVRIRDNLQLEANSYAIKLKGIEIVRAELMADKLLAMSGPQGSEAIEGVATVEPAFNLPATWIESDRKIAAEMEGYTVVEPNAVLATHLSEVIRAHADELLTRQDVKDTCESVREFAPALIEDLIPDKVSINTLHNTLRALLHERIPVKDIITVLETLANYSGTNISQDMLMEKVRESLRRTISTMYLEPDGNLHAISLHPEIEQKIMQAATDSEKIGSVILDPGFAQQFLKQLEITLQQSYSRGIPPVVLVPSPIRLFLKRLVEPTFPTLPVMGYTEITSTTKVQSAGTVIFEGVQNAKQA